MAFDLTEAFDKACPGVVLTRDIDAAIHALGAQPSQSAILAAVLPLIGGSLPVFPSGLKRFADSNPASDGWSIDREAADFSPGGFR